MKNQMKKKKTEMETGYKVVYGMRGVGQYELWPELFKGEVIWGTTIIGVVNGDTRSLDYGS